jgi:hypothetical protein
VSWVASTWWATSKETSRGSKAARVRWRSSSVSESW